ncbi:MAG: hypothetical protein KatS3mg109_0148 [Pirellulaceae bacterium]|nr:MAG: hypothetical protein KatS3mg109_0148 [Pirellulaceae bacterium]
MIEYIHIPAERVKQYVGTDVAVSVKNIPIRASAYLFYLENFNGVDGVRFTKDLDAPIRLMQIKVSDMGSYSPLSDLLQMAPAICEMARTRDELNYWQVVVSDPIEKDGDTYVFCNLLATRK